MKTFNQYTLLFLLVLSRAFFPFANTSSLLACTLFVSWRLPMRNALFFNLACLLASDVAWSLWQHHAIWGSWSLFTYSGIALLTWLMRYVKHNTIFYTPWLITFYWAWTNLASYFLTSMYPHTLPGLLMCYVMALPFLLNSILATCGWLTVFIFMESYSDKRTITLH